MSEERDDPKPPKEPEGEGHPSRLIVTHMSYSGPVPPPAVLQEFERTLPGAANRILALTETQARHRQAIELRLVGAKIRRGSRGQLFAFLVVIAGMSCGTWLATNGQGAFGLASVLAPLTAAAALFIYTRRRQEQERAEKRSRLERR